MPDYIPFAENALGHADDVCFDDAEPEEQRIYSHGFSLRVRLTCRTEIAEEALLRLGWSSTSGDWVVSQVKEACRWSLRGITFLTQRKPRNERLPLARRNKEWKTRLYSLQIERRADSFFIDLHGVRRSDVERLLEHIMLLGPQDYVVHYYRAAERYFVLAPHEAFRLGEELGETARRGLGRIKRRSRRLAKLSVYRIHGGATAAFKVEVRLVGKARDRGTFAESDIGKLDELLHALIAEHDLHPIAKPARWEPCGPVPWSRDGQLERLGRAAYRGRQASPELLDIAMKCHTPEVRLVGESREDTVSSAAQSYIRHHSPSGHLSGSQQTSLEEEVGTPSPPSPETTKRPERNVNLWDSLARDISGYEGYLSEVILHPHQDPMPLVRALDRADPGSIALNALCPVTPEGHARTWGTVCNAFSEYPGTSSTKTLVLVVDVEVLCSGMDAVDLVDEDTGRSIPGPLLNPNWHWDTMPLLIKATAGWMWPMLAELRDICERTGFRVVVVTVDARPEHGYGELQRSHFYRDARVRSHIGDAGRHHCHTRYRVETGRESSPRRVVMVKDEAQGLMGRVIHGMCAA